MKRLDETHPSMADHEIVVELMRLVAMVATGTTGVRANEYFSQSIQYVCILQRRPFRAVSRTGVSRKLLAEVYDR